MVQHRMAWSVGGQYTSPMVKPASSKARTSSISAANFHFGSFWGWRKEKDFASVNTLFGKQSVTVSADKDLPLTIALHPRDERCKL